MEIKRGKDAGTVVEEEEMTEVSTSIQSYLESPEGVGGVRVSVEEPGGLRPGAQ